MKVILTQNVPGTGKKGEIIDVAAGFAQNFLLKKGLAITATKGAVQTIEAREKRVEKEKKNAAKDARLQHRLIEGKLITIKKEANNTGKLYAAITDSEVVLAVKKQLGVVIQVKSVRFSSPIKEKGNYNCQVKIGSQTATISISVL